MNFLINPFKFTNPPIKYTFSQLSFYYYIEMEQFNLDDNIGKLQEKLINHIDQEGNKIISQLTLKLTRMTTKFKGFYMIHFKYQGGK